MSFGGKGQREWGAWGPALGASFPLFDKVRSEYPNPRIERTQTVATQGSPAQL